RDQHLPGFQRRRLRQLEKRHLVAERLDAGGSQAHARIIARSRITPPRAGRPLRGKGTAAAALVEAAEASASRERREPSSPSKRYCFRCEGAAAGAAPKRTSRPVERFLRYRWTLWDGSRTRPLN